MKTEKEIIDDPTFRNVESLVLRELYHMGIKSVYADHLDDKLVLKTETNVVRIPLFEFKEVVRKLKIVQAILLDGKRYDWISDADGSGDSFRNFIQSYIKQSS